MPKNFSRKAFDSWLARHEKEFRFKPFISVSRKDYFKLQFSGLVSALSVHISNRGAFEVLIDDVETGGFDIVTEFDVLAEKNSQGLYSCWYCLEKTYYPDRATLWQKHSFEPLLQWINGITADDVICMIIRDGELAAAHRRKVEELDKSKVPYSRCFPMVEAGHTLIKR